MKEVAILRKMNKWVLKSILAVGSILGVWMVLTVGQAQGSLIGPKPGPEGDKNFDVDFFDGLADEAGYDVIISELDKDEFNDGDPPEDIEDPLHVIIGYYDVQLDEWNGDPRFATISWDFTQTGGQAWYVGVKDGNKSGENVYWVYYEVSPDQRIKGSGVVDTLANGQGNISSIGLYGIPDASALFLLGSACLTGFAVMRKKPKK